MDDIREGAIKKLLAGRSSVSRAEASALGVPWPLVSGWRKAFLESIGHRTFVQKQKEIYAADIGAYADSGGGYLVRARANGRAHILVNGQVLCRTRVDEEKYITAAAVPPGVKVCYMCDGLSKTDPLEAQGYFDDQEEA